MIEKEEKEEEEEEDSHLQTILWHFPAGHIAERADSNLR